VTGSGSSVRWAACALAATLVAAGSGCGGENATPGPPSGLRTLRIYSGLPRHGPYRSHALAVEAGIRLALRERRGRAGRFRLRYVALDDALPGSGWDAGTVQRNARRAADDAAAIAYIGDFESGATAVSLPILNQAGVPQVSPSNTAVGLTRRGAGADEGEPFKYYPTGRRTYVRLVPRDTAQGAVLVGLMRRARCDTLAAFTDGSVYGNGLARIVARNAERAGVLVLEVVTVDPSRSGYADQVRRLLARCTGSRRASPWR